MVRSAIVRARWWRAIATPLMASRSMVRTTCAALQLLGWPRPQPSALTVGWSPLRER